MTAHDRSCKICGKPLPPRRQVYCSDTCRDERWHRELIRRIKDAKKMVGYRPTMWPAIAAEQIRFSPSCARCGSTVDLEAHHIVPLASGGTNELSNLLTLCHDCHRAQHRGKPRKHDPSRTIQEALLIGGQLPRRERRGL